MAHLLKRNDALEVNTRTQNGKNVDIAITVRGSDVYFAVCAVMGFIGLSIIFVSMTRPRTDRVFYYISAAINITAAIAYFAMGSHLGWTPIDVEFRRDGDGVGGINREIFYARYIDWFVTTPLLLMDLLLTAGLPWPTIIWTIFLDWVMIVTGLIGALVKTRYKWGFYAFGCAAMFNIFWNIAWQGRKHAQHLGNDIYRAYMLTGVWTLFIWLLYPVAWGVSEGGNVIPPDSEAAFYGVLDFCAKPIFSIALIIAHWNIDPARLGLKLRDYDTEPDYFGNRVSEKLGGGATNGHGGVTDGAAPPVITSDATGPASAAPGAGTAAV